MPIYEYRCARCDHRLEAFQKISEDPLRDCPECGESSLRKLVSAASFRLKGTGWYETDFKDKPAKGNGKGNGSASAGDGSGSGTTNDNPKSATSTKDKPAASTD